MSKTRRFYAPELAPKKAGEKEYLQGQASTRTRLEEEFWAVSESYHHPPVFYCIEHGAETFAQGSYTELERMLRHARISSVGPTTHLWEDFPGQIIPLTGFVCANCGKNLKKIPIDEDAAEHALAVLLDEAIAHEKKCRYGGVNHSVWYNISYHLSSEINAADRVNRSSYRKEYVTCKTTLENALKEVKALANNPKNLKVKRDMWDKWCKRVERMLTQEQKGQDDHDQ